MKSVRSIKTTYAAAFLLGGLIALLITQPARSADDLSGGDTAQFEAQADGLKPTATFEGTLTALEDRGSISPASPSIFRKEIIRIRDAGRRPD